MFPFTVDCMYGEVLEPPIYMVPYTFLILSRTVSPGQEKPICGGSGRAPTVGQSRLRVALTGADRLLISEANGREPLRCDPADRAGASDL